MTDSCVILPHVSLLPVVCSAVATTATPFFFSSVLPVLSLLTMVTPLLVLPGAAASHSKFSTYEETIGCYECKSNSHLNCRDPFNGSANVFPLEPCKGCCVKIVRNYNTNKESIWRTCTEKLEISNSLIHRDVCMEESNGEGHLCICSEDKCNAAASSRLLPPASSPLTRFPSALASLFLLPLFRLLHLLP